MVRDKGRETGDERKTRYREIMDKRCNPSSYYGLTGMQLRELGEGTSLFIMPVDPRLLDAGGAVSGGALASIADASIGAALSTLIDISREKAVTVEMKINFIAPIREGEITSEGKIIQKGRSVAIGESCVYDSEGELAAKAVATYVVRERGGGG